MTNMFGNPSLSVLSPSNTILQQAEFFQDIDNAFGSLGRMISIITEVPTFLEIFKILYPDIRKCIQTERMLAKYKRIVS